MVFLILIIIIINTFNCSANSFTMYCSCSSSYLPIVANHLNVLHIDRKWFTFGLQNKMDRDRKSEMTGFVCDS